MHQKKTLLGTLLWETHFERWLVAFLNKEGRINQTNKQNTKTWISIVSVLSPLFLRTTKKAALILQETRAPWNTLNNQIGLCNPERMNYAEQNWFPSLGSQRIIYWNLLPLSKSFQGRYKNGQLSSWCKKGQPELVGPLAKQGRICV